MPNIGDLVTSLILSIFVQLRLVSCGFFGRHFLWSAQRLTALRELTRTLSVNQKSYKFQFNRNFCWETRNIFGLV